MKIGLYFGTYNPIHVGHLIIANHMVDYTDLDQVWLVVTPQNPLKNKASLLEDYHRLAIVRIATEDNNKLKASDIEFSLPRPSFTSETLTYIKEKNPEHDFSIIMGEDNIRTFHKWKNHEIILERYSIYVYPRVSSGNVKSRFINHSKIHKVNAPIMEISSTFIRNSIRTGKNIRPLLPHLVWNYIDEMNFYK